LIVCVATVFGQTCTPRGLGRSGVCQNSGTTACNGGQYYRGACPGSAAIQCCVQDGGGNINNDNGGGNNGGGSATGWGSYQAPASARNLLGNLFSLNPTRVSWGYTGAKATFMLPGGSFYFESKMDTDCDGAPSCPSIDPHGQTQTSWTWKGTPIDALKTNYFVLPSNLKGRLGGSRLGLGDVGAVIYNGRLEFAVYADNGPNSKIGEGSVKLVQSLGFNPYKNGRICCGISSGVVVIVFPGSRGTYSSPYDRDSVRNAGMQRLNSLINGGANAMASNDSTYGQTDAASMFNGLVIAAIIVAAVFVIIGVVVLVKLASRNAPERP